MVTHGLEFGFLSLTSSIVLGAGNAQFKKFLAGSISLSNRIDSKNTQKSDFKSFLFIFWKEPLCLDLVLIDLKISKAHLFPVILFLIFHLVDLYWLLDLLHSMPDLT